MGSRKKWLDSRPVEWHFRPTERPVEAVREQLLAALEDCHGFECDRLRWRLHTAECAQELWLLRSSVFQAVAHQHCQAQAAERIAQLLPAFEALLPARSATGV